MGAEKKQELREKIENILSRINKKNEKELIYYDVKDEAEKKYRNGTTNSEKICEYKSAEDGFDADVSLFSIVCYALAFPYVLEADAEKEIGKHDASMKIIRHNSGQKYEIMYEDNKQQAAFHGDTMNSFWTMRNLIEKDLAEVYGPENKEELKMLLENYAKMVHTIGNFIPAPHLYNGRNSGTFNAARYAATKDFWDLTLYWIYQWYKEGRKKEYLKALVGENSSNVRICEYWFNRFRSWDDFVEGNYMQDFVGTGDGEEEKYGRPIEFWEGHFCRESNCMPNPEEAKVFMERVKKLIEKRGEKIAEQIKKELEEKDLKAYAACLAGIVSK